MQSADHIKRIPLWQRPGADPVRLKDLTSIGPNVQTAVKKKRPIGWHMRRPLIAIAEESLGLSELNFNSVVEASVAVGITANCIRNSLKTGCRAGGRLWWYADRPLHQRPSMPTYFRNLPVIIGEKLYPSIKTAAGEFGVSVGVFGNYVRRGHLPHRQPFGNLGSVNGKCPGRHRRGKARRANRHRVGIATRIQHFADIRSTDHLCRGRELLDVKGKISDGRAGGRRSRRYG